MPLALPQEPWRRYRSRRFLVHTTSRMPNLAGQENDECQRDIQTLVVVSYKDQVRQIPHIRHGLFKVNITRFRT